MRQFLLSRSFLLATLAATGTAFATGARGSTFFIDDFTDMNGGQFYDILVASPGSGVDRPEAGAEILGVTIAASPTTLDSEFSFSPIVATASDPGDGRGYLLYDPLLTVVLDFDVPVSAFGVSFAHGRDIVGVGNYHWPGKLALYAGPSGSGDLIGEVLSSGTDPGGPSLVDFVGFGTAVPRIRSAVISSTGLDSNGQPRRVFIDGYGLSLTPVPEPSTLLLGATAGVGLLLRTRFSH